MTSYISFYVGPQNILLGNSSTVFGFGFFFKYIEEYMQDTYKETIIPMGFDRPKKY